MRKTLLVAAGGTVGYVLGARAGRPAYDRLVSGWHRMTRSDGVGAVARSVTNLRDATRRRATDEVDGVLDRAADAVADGDRTGDGKREHATVVAPTPSAGRRSKRGGSRPRATRRAEGPAHD